MSLISEKNVKNPATGHFFRTQSFYIQYTFKTCHQHTYNNQQKKHKIKAKKKISNKDNMQIEANKNT